MNPPRRTPIQTARAEKYFTYTNWHHKTYSPTKLIIWYCSIFLEYLFHQQHFKGNIALNEKLLVTQIDRLFVWFGFTSSSNLWLYQDVSATLSWIMAFQSSLLILMWSVSLITKEIDTVNHCWDLARGWTSNLSKKGQNSNRFQQKLISFAFY